MTEVTMNRIHDAHAATAARGLLITAGALIICGNVATTVVSSFHPHEEDPNDHPAVFTEYAASETWIGVHYGQLATALLMLAGLVVLYRALTLARRPSAVDTVALVAVSVTAAAVTVLQAIDGVALKHTVDAWIAAPEPQKAARFAGAETVRWLEWGANSFFYAMLGLTLLAFGAAMLRGGVPRWLGGMTALTGIAFVANAVPVGFRGFESTPAAWIAVVGVFTIAAGMIVAGLRVPRQVPVDQTPTLPTAALGGR
jgi:hypothetical protein